MSEKTSAALAKPKTNDVETDEPKASAADRLVALARKNCVYFHTPDKIAYARVACGDHSEVWAVDSSEFRAWIEAKYYRLTGTGLQPRTLEMAISTLSAHAKYDGLEHTVHLRSAKHDGKYYIDLCDDEWRVVEVSSKGWKVLATSPVMFTRTPSMRELPVPVEGGKFKGILDFANVPKDSWVILYAWVIECFRPETPYVGLALIGEHGSAKSSAQSFLRDLVDPNKHNLRVAPKSVQDIDVAAGSAHLLSYENLSVLSDEMQDRLCSILTGAGSAGRKLYTDDQEVVIGLKRPVALNSIDHVVTRPDLLDRFICLELPSIEKGRKTEVEMHANYDKMRPRFFGAILTRFARALALLPAVVKETRDLPRMADFALLGEAVARSLKRKPGDFLARFNKNRRDGIEDTIDDNVVGDAIRQYLQAHKGGLEGTFAQLNAKLQAHCRAKSQSQGAIKDWPKNGKAFGSQLRRLKPAMKLIGILIERLGRSGSGYIWRLGKSKASNL